MSFHFMAAVTICGDFGGTPHSKKINKYKKIKINSTFRTLKIVASVPITSWQIDGETVDTVTDFILWGSKITTDGDCSH